MGNVCVCVCVCMCVCVCVCVYVYIYIYTHIYTYIYIYIYIYIGRCSFDDDVISGNVRHNYNGNNCGILKLRVQGLNKIYFG
jgi:hypothetical protein